MRAASRIFLILLLPAAIPISGDAPKAPIDEGTPVIAFPGAPSGIDPRMPSETYRTQVLQITHASPFRMDAAGNPVPDLAESWGERPPHRGMCDRIAAIKTPDEDYPSVKDMIITEEKGAGK